MSMTTIGEWLSAVNAFSPPVRANIRSHSRYFATGMPAACMAKRLGAHFTASVHVAKNTQCQTSGCPADARYWVDGPNAYTTGPTRINRAVCPKHLALAIDLAVDGA
jgi:hypothetical protein